MKVPQLTRLISVHVPYLCMDFTNAALEGGSLDIVRLRGVLTMLYVFALELDSSRPANGRDRRRATHLSAVETFPPPSPPPPTIYKTISGLLSGFY